MKKVFLGLALLMTSILGHAGDTLPSVSISSSAAGDIAWIVIDGEVYMCILQTDMTKICTHFILPEADGSTSWGTLGK